MIAELYSQDAAARDGRKSTTPPLNPIGRGTPATPPVNAIRLGEEPEFRNVLSRLGDLEDRGDGWDQLKNRLEQSKIQQEGNQLRTDGKLTKIDKKLQDLSDKLQSLDAAMKLMESMGNSNTDGGAGLLDTIKQMEQNLHAHLEDKFALKADLEALKVDHAALKETVDVDHEERLKALENVRCKKLEDANKNMTDQIFALRNFKNDALPRIEDLEEKMAKVRGGDSISLELNVDNDADSKVMGKLNSAVRKLEMRLEDKADRSETLSEFKTVRETLDLFNTTMASFKEQANEEKEVSCTAEEREKWNANINKTVELEQLILALSTDLRAYDEAKVIPNVQQLLMKIAGVPTKESVDRVTREISRITEILKENKEEIMTARDDQASFLERFNEFEQDYNQEIGQIKGSTKWCEDQISMMKKMLQRLTEQAKQAGAGGNLKTSFKTSDNLGNSELERIVKVMQVELREHIQQTDRTFLQVHHELDDKATKKMLSDLEQKLLDKINDLLTQLDARYADKDQTRKKFASVEKNIKKLYELLDKLKEVQVEREDNAMFTKKPYGPVNCASCEKDIVNLEGTKAEYIVWKRLPFREPNDRIAKYGPGFSKMLNMIKTKDDDVHGVHTYHAEQHNSQVQTPSRELLQAQYNVSGGKTSRSPHKTGRAGSLDMHATEVLTATKSPGKHGTSNYRDLSHTKHSVSVPSFHPKSKLVRQSVDREEHVYQASGGDSILQNNSELLPNVRGATRLNPHGQNQ